jgi:hypothetical protein
MNKYFLKVHLIYSYTVLILTYLLLKGNKKNHFEPKFCTKNLIFHYPTYLLSAKLLTERQK